MVSLGKTSTPEFGSPCYTEPEGRAAGGDAVGPHPDGRRLLGRRGRRGRGRTGAGRPGLRRRRLDPDPRVVLRAGRAQADPRSDQRLPDVRRPGRPGDCRLHRAHGRGTRPRCSTSSPVVGRVIRRGRHLRPRRSWLPATATRAGSGSLASSTPVITDTPVDPECVQAYEDASRLLESLGHDVVDVPVPLPPEAVPVFETCWAVLTALSVVPPEQEHLLRPLTRWLTERGRAVSGPEFGLAIGAMRRFAARRARGAGAVRRRADPDPGRAAAAGRRDPRRRRPGGRLRGAEGLHPLDVGLERHRHAGGLAAAALDRRTGCPSA